MLRHGLVALVLVALLAPMVPASPAPMACCRGTGEACSCPIQPGFARCPAPETAAAAPQVLRAVLPPARPSFLLAIAFDAPAEIPERLSALAPRPLVPPPRG